MRIGVGEKSGTITLDDIAFDISGRDIGEDNATAKEIARGAGLLAVVHSAKNFAQSRAFADFAKRVRDVVKVDIEDIPFDQVVAGQPPLDIAGNDLRLASDALEFVTAGVEYVPPMAEREERVWQAAQVITEFAEGHA